MSHLHTGCVPLPRLLKVRRTVPEDETHDATEGAWSVKLPDFEGPLDLLLHLCQKHELDILNIPVGFVTEKYLEYLATMEIMQLDVAAEYLVMAATLVHIKSRSLLPTPPPDQGDDSIDLEGEDIDPREALIRRLLEYQKYKQAADRLASRGVAGRDVFLRGSPAETLTGGSMSTDGEGTKPAPLAEVPLFALVDAFQRVLARRKLELSHDIIADRISLSDRIGELSDILSRRRRLSFEELFDGASTKFDLIITFLALLEMTRLKLTRLFQSEPLAPLYVELSATAADVDTVDTVDTEKGGGC
jgi:segregation and condensation protein A